MDLESYTGVYNNELYGNIEIEKDAIGRGLQINFKGHNKLNATVQYMDNDEWLLTYNNLSYGIFAVKFVQSKNKVRFIDIRVNEFIDYDAYTFTKKN